MTEMEFLDSQQTLATQRLLRVLLGGDATQPPLLVLEQAAARHPWVAVGAAAGLGGLLGVSLRSPAIRRMLTEPAWKSLLGKLLLALPKLPSA